MFSVKKIDNWSHILYSGGGPSTYVYCVVCYHVIVGPYVRSVGHVFAYLYTLDDDSECPTDYETSLFRKVFPLYCFIHVRAVKLAATAPFVLVIYPYLIIPLPNPQYRPRQNIF